MQFIRGKILPAISFKVGLVVILILATIGFLAPRTIGVIRAENCSNAPSVPTLNPYPLTFDASTVECKDYPLVMMKKVNGGSYPSSLQEMQAGITASAGEELFVTVYIHNGAATNFPDSQTLAKNVLVMSIVPTSTGSTRTIQIRAGADNAEPIYQNYYVNTGPNDRLEVVANSGERFNNNGQIMESGFAMGNNTIVVGDLKACFEYSRFYRFRVKVVGTTPPQQSQLSIVKEVRNVTANRSFMNNETAYQNDTVEYRIKVSSTTATPVNNVVVTDTFNSQLEYINNSLMVNGQSSQTGLTTGGLRFSSVNQSGVEIKYQAKVLASSGTLTNTAAATGDNVNRVEDQANVTVNQPQTQNTTLTINKEVRNVTRNTTFAKSVDAENGQQVEYRIRISNTGSATAKNVVLTDSLNNTGINPTGSLNVDRNYSGTLISGLNLNELAVNSTVTVTYLANVTRDSITVTNTAQATASNASSVQSSATVNVLAPSKGNLILTKYVRTLNGSFQKSVNVQNNEIVEYRLVVSVNSGRVQNIYLTDTLPSGLQYMSGTLKLDGNFIGDNYSYINIGTLENGLTKTVMFQARAVAPINQTNITLTNTGIARGDNVTEVQDTATVYINQVIGSSQLSITKNVRNLTQNTGLQKTVTANNGDRARFEIVLRNIGTREVTNVRLNDNWNGDLQFNSVSISGDMSSSLNGGANGNFQGYFGTLQPNQERRVVMEGTVNYSGTGNWTLNNFAQATGDNVSQVQDQAGITAQSQVQGSVTQSKRAFNDTQNVDATSRSAAREDFITYTLTVNNSGSASVNNYIITDDLSGVLVFADMVDAGGGTVNGQTLSYAPISIPAGGSVSKSFKVRVKYSLAPNLTFTMTNTYGNTINILIQTPAPVPPIVSPKTGAGTNAVVFGGLASATYGLWLGRKIIIKFISA